MPHNNNNNNNNDNNNNNNNNTTTKAKVTCPSRKFHSYTLRVIAETCLDLLEMIVPTF